VYKAEVEIPLTLSVSADLSPDVFDAYEGYLLDAFKAISELG